MQNKNQITNFKHTCIVCEASIDMKLKSIAQRHSLGFFLCVCECCFFFFFNVPEVELRMENMCILYLWDIRTICVKQ